MSKNMTTIMHLLQMTDSAFPVGTFSFSNGLETAAHEKLVTDASSLEAYTRSITRQAAFSDGIACLHAYRAALENRYDDVLEADHRLIQFKMNDEARQMLCRMGKKLAELGKAVFNAPMMQRWLEDIQAEQTPGTYPVAQALAGAATGLSEADLFASHLYGAANMVLSAALRCVRVSHYDTQRILYHLAEEAGATYDEVRTLGFDDMNAFVPQADILASLHEKGNMRMFMN